MVKQTWGERIKNLRTDNDWSQDIMAELFGLQTKGAVSLLENGEREPTGPIKRVIEALEKNPTIFSKQG